LLGVDENRHSGAKAPITLHGSMYGLKPVPFNKKALIEFSAGR
jgi:hypothetical protein